MSKYKKIICFAIPIFICVVIALVLPLCLSGSPSQPIKVCHITFYDEDGQTILGEVYVKENDSAEIETPVKEANSYYTYTFLGWLDENGEPAAKSLACVKDDMGVYASYAEEIRYYTVTYCDYNGSEVLFTFPIQAGEREEQGLNTIMNRDSDANYDYTFAGWVDENGNDVTEKLECVLEDMTVYASYTKQERRYTIQIPQYVKVLYGSYITSENASQAKLPYGAEITISYEVPEGYVATLSVRGATAIDKDAGKYRVTSNVVISLSLTEQQSV